MTEEFKMGLVAKYKEEASDMECYEKMAKQADSHGMKEVAGILRDISKDEESHKNVIGEILEMEES